MTDHPEPGSGGGGGLSPERTEAGESAPGRFVPAVWGDAIARAIAGRVRMLIVHANELRRAADAPTDTEDRARTLMALVEADERLTKVLFRLEPWRSDSDDATDV